MPAKHHAVGRRGLGLLRQRAVVGRVLVDRLVGGDRQALRLGRGLDVARQARAVDLLVVEQLHLGAAVLLHQRRQRGALDRVLGDDAGVGALPRRVVLVRLTGRRARLVRGQADGRVGRADLRDAGLVEDRDRHGAGARVELAEVDGRRLVLRGLARVGRGLLRRPVGRLGGRVVERRVLDADVARLAAGLLERQLGAVDRGLGLRAAGPLQRIGRVDRHRLGRRRARGLVRVRAVAATGGDAESEHGNEAACSRHGT